MSTAMVRDCSVIDCVCISRKGNRAPEQQQLTPGYMVVHNTTGHEDQQTPKRKSGERSSTSKRTRSIFGVAMNAATAQNKHSVHHSNAPAISVSHATQQNDSNTFTGNQTVTEEHI